MRSKKRILIIISIAAALLLSAGAISFAAWSGVGSSVSAAGITGSISYINGMTVESPDGENNKEKTSITMTKPLYPVDQIGLKPDQKCWKFVLTADISGQLDTLYSISGSLKQGEQTLPAGSAQLYWSESAPTENAPADSHAFGSGKSYLRDLTVTGDNATATLYVYMEAFSTEVMNANVFLEFGIAAAQSMTFNVRGHKMGSENKLSGNATFTNKSDPYDTFNVTLNENGTATAKVFAPAEYEVVYDNGKDYNSGRIECAAGESATDVMLEYKRFDLWLGWDGADHDMSKVNETKPEIGVNLGADGKNKTLNVISRDSYKDVAVTLWMKAKNSVHIWDVQGLLLKFEGNHTREEDNDETKNHQYMFLHSKKSQFSEQYQLLWGGNFDGSGQWHGNPTWTAVEETNLFVDPFTEKQSSEFAGSDGLRVTVVRRGATLLTYIGNDKTLVQSGIMLLPSEYANDKVKVGFWDYDSKANATWKFEITEDIESIDEVNIPKEFVVPSGSQYGHGTLEFRKTAGEKYQFGEGAQITLKPDEGYIMGSLTVSGKSVELDVKDNKYSFAVLDDISSVRATFIKNEPLNAVKFIIPANANANGMKFTLYREIDGVTVTKSGTVADNSFTLLDVMPGRWNAKTTVYGVDAYLKGVYVGSDNVNVDMTGVFGSPEAINFGSDKVFNNGIRVRYTIPANIGGDAYFGMKLKSTTDTSGMDNDSARFGLRLFYAGENGYDTELSVTLLVKNKKWILQTCGAKFDEVALPDAILSALKDDGVYMAVKREALTGEVYVYMGKNKTIGTGDNDIKEIVKFSSVAEQISKKNIVRFGAAFWGGNFNATVSDLMYSDTSIGEALGIDTTAQDVTLTVKGRKNGEIVNLNGQIKLTSSFDSSVNETVTLTNGTAESVTLKTPLTYNVAFVDNNDDNNQYYDGTLTLDKGDTAATVTLEYKRFNMWTTNSPWEEYHDFTKVNDSLPEIGNDGKTLNVISRDSYGDVAASLWMKKGNTTHSQDVQGIFVKFEDGKYMFLRCEKIAANAKDYPGQYKLQWAKNFDGEDDLKWGGIDVQSVIESWKDFVLPLTAEQNTKFESDEGLKVTLVRKGNTLFTYVDNKPIAGGTVTLPDGYGDDQVKVGFWDYNSKANATWKFDIHSLKATDCIEKEVTLTVNGHKKGATNALSGNVTLTKVIDSGGTNTHTVTLNNKGTATVNLITPASYNVHYENGDYYDGVIVLAKGATTATVVLEYRRLELWHGWDGAQHDFSRTNDAQPVIGNNGKTLNVITRDKYGDVSVSLWMKNGNSTHSKERNSGVQGVFVKYADGKYMFLRMLRDDTQDKKPHRFQWAPNFGSSDGKWNGNDVNSVMNDPNVWIECGNGQYETELNSTDGLKVTVKRTGNKLEVYLNDELMSNMTQTLPAEYADDQVQVGFWDYDSKANATWRFDITETLPNDLPAEQA